MARLEPNIKLPLLEKVRPVMKSSSKKLPRGMVVVRGINPDGGDDACWNAAAAAGVPLGFGQGGCCFSGSAPLGNLGDFGFVEPRDSGATPTAASSLRLFLRNLFMGDPFLKLKVLASLLDASLTFVGVTSERSDSVTDQWLWHDMRGTGEISSGVHRPLEGIEIVLAREYAEGASSSRSILLYSSSPSHSSRIVTPEEVLASPESRL